MFVKKKKMNDELDYQLYVIAELSYKKAHPEIEEEELFPIEWYGYNNYKLKTEIIAEAIKDNILVNEVPSYNELIEQVKYN